MADENIDNDLFNLQSSKVNSNLWDNEDDIPKGKIQFIHDVPLKMIAQIGSVQKTVRDVISLKLGHVIEFTKVVGEPIDVMIGGRLMCRGEIVVVNERYGIRISEVVRADDHKL